MYCKTCTSKIVHLINTGTTVAVNMSGVYSWTEHGGSQEGITKGTFYVVF